MVFLYITLNLINGKHQPYRKPNDEPLYVDRHSNHPPSIIKQLPASINKRMSMLLSDEQSFNTAVPIYEDALRRSHFDDNIHFEPNTPQDTTSTQRKRKKNTIWFNQPKSKNVKTNVGLKFLNLIDRHFKSTTLHRIFNRNTIEVIYICMDNVKRIISKHNFHVLSKKGTESKET